LEITRPQGNDRLPFDARAILRDGKDDQDAVIVLMERMDIDWRQRNVAVAWLWANDWTAGPTAQESHGPPTQPLAPNVTTPAISTAHAGLDLARLAGS